MKTALEFQLYLFHLSGSCFQSLVFKKESTRNSSKKGTKTVTLYQDYLHRIANHCAAVLNIF